MLFSLLPSLFILFSAVDFNEKLFWQSIDAWESIGLIGFSGLSRSSPLTEFPRNRSIYFHEATTQLVQMRKVEISVKMIDQTKQRLIDVNENSIEMEWRKVEQERRIQSQLSVLLLSNQFCPSEHSSRWRTNTVKCVCEKKWQYELNGKQKWRGKCLWRRH